MASLSARPLSVGATRASELSRSNRTTRAMLLGFGFSGIAIALMAAIAAWVSWGFEYALLNVAGAASLGALLLVVVLKRDYDFTEPISLVLLAVGIGVTLKPAYLLFGPREAWPYLLLDRPDPLFLLTPALLVTASMAALAVGYLALSPRSYLGRLRLLDGTPWSEKRLALASVVAFVLSITAMALYVQKLGIDSVLDDISGKRFQDIEGEGYATSLGYYRWAASLTQPALLMTLAWALHKYRRMPPLIAFGIATLALTAMAFPFFNSSRTGIVTVLLQAFVVWRCVRGRLPKGVVLGFSVAVFALLLIVTALRPKRATTSDFDVSETIGLDLAADVTVGSRHFLDLSRTAHIIAGVPEKIPYQYGRTYLTWITMPIPRTWWPGKPALGSGPIIGPQIFGTGGSGVPPGMVGELWLNFGLVGVIFGALFMGALLRFAYEQFRHVLTTPVGAVLYSGVVIPLGWNAVTGDFSRMLVASLTNLLPVILALYFLTAPARRSRRRRRRALR